ncbi:hypothetical protein SDC9_193663 [bioreactor metagenome]|uniref:Uncharacterized protein n=1 Tax=bioreactor metagenome TaxID=1076179 RepID=A0A645IFD4_9ZZZZ
MRQNGSFVIRRRLPLDKGNGIGGAGGQAIAQSVAIVVPQKLGLPVYHTDGSFMTGSSARAAAVALILIDLNNRSLHI